MILSFLLNMKLLMEKFLSAFCTHSHHLIMEILAIVIFFHFLKVIILLRMVKKNIVIVVFSCLHMNKTFHTEDQLLKFVKLRFHNKRNTPSAIEKMTYNSCVMFKTLDVLISSECIFKSCTYISQTTNFITMCDLIHYIIETDYIKEMKTCVCSFSQNK